MRYRYTSYTHSRLATALDKFCHTPIRITIFFVPLIILTYLFICMDYLPNAEKAQNLIGTVMGISFVVCLLGSFFLGIICDKCKLSQRLALWDIRRQQNGGKLSPKFWIVTILIVLLLAAPGVAALVYHMQSENAADAYHESMSMLDSETPPEIAGSKFVSFDTVEGRYSTTYIPEHLQAETPRDVRYILHYTNGEELYGTYENTTVGAYQYTCLVELMDRESGALIASQLFYGGNPPMWIDDEKSPQYGSKPDAEEIMAWVESVLG